MRVCGFFISNEYGFKPLHVQAYKRNTSSETSFHSTVVNWSFHMTSLMINYTRFFTSRFITTTSTKRYTKDFSNISRKSKYRIMDKNGKNDNFSTDCPEVTYLLARPYYIGFLFVKFGRQESSNCDAPPTKNNHSETSPVTENRPKAMLHRRKVEFVEHLNDHYVLNSALHSILFHSFVYL